MVISVLSTISPPRKTCGLSSMPKLTVCCETKDILGRRRNSYQHATSIRSTTSAKGAQHRAVTWLRWAGIFAVVVSAFQFSAVQAEGSPSNATSASVGSFVWNQRGLVPASIPEFETRRSSLTADSDFPTGFRCFTGTPSWVPASRINDNYCDCEDGSDEPGTSACSAREHLYAGAAKSFPESVKALSPNFNSEIFSKLGRPPFYCANVGFKALFLPHSRVDDGVCDCCDGSDEAGVGTQCSLTCSMLDAELQQELTVRRRQLGTAISKLRSMSTIGARARTNFVHEIQKLKLSVIPAMEDKLRHLEAKEQQLQAEAERKTSQESGEHPHPISNTLRPEMDSIETTSGEDKLSISTRRPSQKRGGVHDYDTAPKEGSALVSEYSAWMDRKNIESEDLERVGILDSEPKPLRATPPVETELVSAVEDSPESNESSLSEDSRDEPLTDSLVQSKAKDSNIHTPGIAPWTPISMDEGPVDDGDSEPQSPVAQLAHRLLDILAYVEAVARTLYRRIGVHWSTAPKPQSIAETQRDIWKVKSSMAEKRNELTRLENLLHSLEGVPDALLALAGECYSSPEQGRYIYEVCFFKDASQREIGKSSYRLGSFEFVQTADPLPTIEEVASSDKIPSFSIRFSNGQHCPTGPPRSLMLSLVCGAVNELVTSTELERCTYVGVFRTPAACLFAPTR